MLKKDMKMDDVGKEFDAKDHDVKLEGALVGEIEVETIILDFVTIILF